MKPPTRCITAGCGELTYKTRCDKHNKLYNKERIQKEHWRDYGPNWKFIRARVLKAEPNCRLCGDKANEVDHIISLQNGGTHELDNLRPLCKSCHSRRTYYDTLARKKNKKEG